MMIYGWQKQPIGASRRICRQPIRLEVESLEERIVPSFLPSISLDVGGYPSGVAATDLNKDGFADLISLAVAPDHGNSFDFISVRLGNGNGTFQGSARFDVDGVLWQSAIGDFNGDGSDDLLVSAPTSATRLFLGKGDGTFQVPAIFTVPNFAGSHTVGDFNGDGHLDLAVPIAHGSTLSTFLGTGQEGFIPGAQVPAIPGRVFAISSGDFNIDGNLDLVTVGYELTSPYTVSENFMQIFIGDGQGGLQALGDPEPIGHGGFPLVVADFNADGKPDIAFGDGRQNLKVLLGSGNGTFLQAADSAVGMGQTSILAEDLNADGKLDLAITTTHDRAISILHGNGNGSFQRVEKYSVGTGPLSATVIDFNGDGWLDLAVANMRSSDVSILLAIDPKIDQLVSNLYHDLLGRQADDAGLHFWTVRLAQGASRSWVVRAFQTSSEYRNMLVDSLYERYLGRDADPDGLDFALDFLASGGTAERLQAYMLGSPEFLQKQGGGTTAGFLAALYDDVLGRTVDPAGADFWPLQVDGTEASRTQVALAVLGTRESNRREVDAFYVQYLHRPADVVGLDFFTDLLRDGMSNELVARALLSSTEYFDR